MALQIIRKWGDRMSNSDKRSETNTVAVQPLTASRNILVLIFITAHVCFFPILCEYASPHIRLWAWCLHSNWAWSTGHHKWEALHDFPWQAALQELCQLANGRKVGTREAAAVEKESWELKDQVFVHICQRRLAWCHVNPSDWQTQSNRLTRIYLCKK